MGLIHRCFAIMLTLALAAYGVAATGPAHEHNASGFHAVHVVSDHDHDVAVGHRGDDADRDDAGQPGDDPMSPVSMHSESGFHSHAAPQFGSTDVATVIAVAFTSRRIELIDPDDLAAVARDDSPFKPPRVL